jgi:thiamine biosynthesis lipoprotein
MEELPRRAFVEQIMGLPISIHVRGPAAREERTAALVQDVYTDLRQIDALFSTYRPDSQVSRINAGTLDLADADPLLDEIHLLADIAEEATDGRFSIYLPDADGTTRLDPSGIVKGWAAQRAFARLQTLDQDICLNAGGDVIVSTAAGGPPWQIGIEHPQTDQLLGVLLRAAGAVATSGTRARGEHLIDPRDGSHPQPLHQVTVAGPSLIWADILATAAFIQGPDAVDWLADIPHYEGLSIARSGLVRTTAGFWSQHPLTIWSTAAAEDEQR